MLLLSLHSPQNATKYQDATIQGNGALWLPHVVLGCLLFIFKLYCWKKKKMSKAFQGFKLSPHETKPAYVGWDQGQCNPGTSTSHQAGTPIAQKSENIKIMLETNRMGRLTRNHPKNGLEVRPTSNGVWRLWGLWSVETEPRCVTPYTKHRLHWIRTFRASSPQDNASFLSVNLSEWQEKV